MIMQRNVIRGCFWAGVGLIAASGGILLLAGCMSLEQMAPSVEGGALASSLTADVTVATAARGRVIYLTKCIDCHGARPIGDYSQAEWDAILPKMHLKAKLTAEEASDVDAYIRSARQYLSEVAAGSRRRGE